MSTRHLTLAEMRPGPVFKNQVAKLVATMAGEDASRLAHPQLLLDLYGADLTYEGLSEIIFGYIEATARNSLFARQGAPYDAFIQQQREWVAKLFADRDSNSRRKKSKFLREENTTADFLNDFTGSIQWDSQSHRLEQYDNRFYEDIKNQRFETRITLVGELTEITDFLFPIVLNVIDIAIHDRAAQAAEDNPLPAAAIDWLDDLFAWFNTVYTWREIALANIAALAR